MKVADRNKLIAECVGEYQKVHDENFPRGKPLDDSEWEKLVHKMDAIADKYRSEIPNISGSLCMAYLNDIEEYDRKWRKYLDK